MPINTNVETAVANRPVKDVVINKVKIIRVGSKAKKYDAVKTWNEMEPNLVKIQEKKMADELFKLDSLCAVRRRAARTAMARTG